MGGSWGVASRFLAGSYVLFGASARLGSGSPGWRGNRRTYSVRALNAREWARTRRLRPTPSPCGLVGRLPSFGLAGWRRLSWALPWLPRFAPNACRRSRVAAGMGPDAPHSAHPQPLWVGRTLTPLRPRGLEAAVAVVGGWPLAVPQARKMSIRTGPRESVSRFGSDSGTNPDRDTTPRHPHRYSSRKTSRKWISFREIASITRYGSLPPFPPNTWQCSGVAAGMGPDAPPSAMGSGGGCREPAGGWVPAVAPCWLTGRGRMHLWFNDRCRPGLNSFRCPS